MSEREKTIEDFISVAECGGVYTVSLRSDCPHYEYMRINIPYSGVVKKRETVLYISIYSVGAAQLKPPAIFVAPLDGVIIPCVSHDDGKVTQFTDSKILYFNTDAEYVKKIRAETESRHRNNRIEAEKREIAKRLKEKERRRQLEKQVRQELIEAGELMPAAGREPIPRDIVDAVYTRDGGRCVYCGSTDKLQIDHIIPFSKGGVDTVENFQILCQRCNIEKSNKIG